MTGNSLVGKLEMFCLRFRVYQARLTGSEFAERPGCAEKTCQQQGGYIVLLNLRFSSDLRFDIAGPESFRMTSQILSRLL